MRYWLILTCFLTNPILAYAMPCANLDPLVCLSSVECTLDCERSKAEPEKCLNFAHYSCHPAQGVCELGIKQSELTQETCESKSGCLYRPANCFCMCDFTEDCDCECGGGPPATCVSKKN